MTSPDLGTAQEELRQFLAEVDAVVTAVSALPLERQAGAYRAYSDIVHAFADVAHVARLRPLPPNPGETT